MKKAYVLAAVFLYFKYAAWKKKRTAKGADKMGEALLTIQNLSAWYTDGKKLED